ncbi:uncharacterized protein BDZ83DRAFT_628361 [Colletotrichum acutatum]|uniref:Uncharacterized protein n=1 Tax=Glomerella acutata TaxID=27357 RepID=A0AAD8XFC9_GLOAC|nr:uncharacterized protein BDZ83DRAFT_628361 [Colletotrichum acutatum]KAK1722758.1 hypothetical protein BDZ83DRAFT_628361 [Colletotrichum acutatum]
MNVDFTKAIDAMRLAICVESLSATCQQLSASTKIQQYQGIEIEYTQEQQNYCCCCCCCI